MYLNLKLNAEVISVIDNLEYLGHNLSKVKKFLPPDPLFHRGKSASTLCPHIPLGLRN